MNILIFLFLPLAAHGDAPCQHLSVNSAEIHMVDANHDGSSRTGYIGNGHGLTKMGVIGADRAEQGNRAETTALTESDDLLFYFSSHAQAVGVTSGPTMTPWLELRPIGEVEHGVLTKKSEPAPGGEDRACSRSAVNVPASAPAPLSGDV
jgi:hypothetical protein